MRTRYSQRLKKQRQSFQFPDSEIEWSHSDGFIASIYDSSDEEIGGIAVSAKPTSATNVRIKYAISDEEDISLVDPEEITPSISPCESETKETQLFQISTSEGKKRLIPSHESEPIENLLRCNWIPRCESETKETQLFKFSTPEGQKRLIPARESETRENLFLKSNEIPRSVSETKENQLFKFSTAEERMPLISSRESESEESLRLKSSNSQVGGVNNFFKISKAYPHTNPARTFQAVYQPPKHN